MAVEKRKFLGLSQYRGAFCYELAGKHFHIVMDDWGEYSLYFLDGENVQVAKKGEPYVWESYECLKGDDTTFLVHITPSNKKNWNYTLVLDTLQCLVTVVTMEEGYDAEFPRLIRTTPYFGAIKMPGRELPTIRHHFDDRMLGEHVTWRYNDGMGIMHIYHTPTSMRGVPDFRGLEPWETFEGSIEAAINSEDPEIHADGLRRKEELYARRKVYPFYDEECFHIWINEHLNLFCFLEEHMVRTGAEKNAGGGGVLLLQDIYRLIDVGVSYSKGEYYMCAAYGQKSEREDPLDTRETPFDWSNLTAMPSIYWDIPGKIEK